MQGLLADVRLASTDGISLERLNRSTSDVTGHPGDVLIERHLPLNVWDLAELVLKSRRQPQDF